MTGAANECKRHGKFIGFDCPVCEGRSTGRSWATETGGKIARNHADDDPNGDSDDVLASPPYAPEIDRAWTGKDER